MKSIYQEVLGPDFGRLQPELQQYFGLHAGSGQSGVGTGVFDVAGTPAWFARPASLRPSGSSRTPPPWRTAS
jgi:hypothetical protein